MPVIDRRQVQLALSGLDVGAVAVPLDVDPRRGERAPDQVRFPPPAPPGRVVTLRPRLRRPARPISRISPATVFLLTAQPGLLQRAADPR
ncbi:MAG TPA: hypothetical protein VF070_48785 [Streptosporangiaceae bacterium]